MRPLLVLAGGLLGTLPLAAQADDQAAREKAFAASLVAERLLELGI